MAKVTEFTLESGRVLEIKRVNTAALETFITAFVSELGVDPTKEPGDLLKLPPEKALRAGELMTQIMTYCAGWGVVESPNGNSEILELMGVDTEKPHLMRAAWVLNELCTTQQEKAELMAAVMSYAYLKDAADAASENEAESQEKIAELEAQLEKMKAETKEEANRAAASA